MGILRAGTSRLLAAGDRAKGGFWRWTLSFVVLAAGVFGVVYSFSYAFEWLLGEEALQTVFWEDISKTRDEALLTYSYLFIGIALTIPAISLSLRVLHLRLADIIAPLSRPSWSLAAVVAVSTFFLMALVTLVSIWTYDDQSRIDFDPLPLSSLHFIPIILVAIVFQASAEELLLRGHLLQLVGRWTRNAWIILVVISGLFAALHFVNPEIDAFGLYAYFHYIVAALLFTSLALITGRLEYSIGTHIGWNWLLLIVDIDSPSAPDLYSGLGVFVYLGDLQIRPYDWIVATLQHLVIFLFCLIIHFEYVEPREKQGLR